MLQLKNLKKSYTTGDFTQVALNNVSMNFRKSEFVAILGPSGSGKTTLLNIVGGLDRYDSGDLVINGKSTHQFKDKEWDAYRNNSVGFIFQSYNLISHLSILDNVEMGMTLSGVKKKEKRERALSVLERVGLKEHTHKKPNQLSGGQMQRVAIARALANDPDIILADEPTGALDTHTSEQILELIQEIAKDKLVVMVTHNPELAEQYADRIVNFRDGEIEEDSNPYNEGGDTTDYSLKKTAMSAFTAFNLSARNIATKKMRTALTAFAASIGIIGIALILSLSNGFQMQIDDFQTNALGDFPILITPQAMTLTGDQAHAFGVSESVHEDFPDIQEVIPFNPADDSVLHTNRITQEYLDYVQKLSPEHVESISFMRTVGMNILRQVDGRVEEVRIGANAMQGAVSTPMANMQSTQGMSISNYPEPLQGAHSSFLKDNYEVLAGHFPENAHEVVLVVDEQNRVPEDTLSNIGLPSNEHINFDEIVGMTMRIIPNDVFYQKTPLGNFLPNTELEEMYNHADTITLTVVAVIREQEGQNLTFLSEGIAYSDGLITEVINREVHSEIVQAQRKSNANVMTMQEFVSEDAKEQFLTFLGGSTIPAAIMIYPTDFEAKDAILDYLNKWNDGRDAQEKIIPTDLAQTITDLTGGIMDGITMVLIAFASISLVVSLIMVGIITYISVLERTKEIGVLRALGARKKDITRVFNAETFIIGAASGLLGIGIAYILTIPANHIIENATGLSNVAQLNPLHAVLLVTISVVLTLIGGALPARWAAKKDPVIALRTE